MKQFFPFTDYDFYAYLTAGLTVLFAIDYVFNNGAIMLRESWPFVQIVFVLAIGYIVGHIIAGLSSVLFEHWLARRVLRPPITAMLCLSKLRFRERLAGRLVGRYYEPLPPATRKAILARVASTSDCAVEDIRDPEEVFQVAFSVARRVADTAQRLDDFRKLYGFSRNMAFAALIAAGALAWRGMMTSDASMYWWALLVMAGAVTLFVRFLKFYAAYAAEVLRTYAYADKEKKT